MSNVPSAIFLARVLERGWPQQDRESRVLAVTRSGRQAFRERFGIEA